MDQKQEQGVPWKPITDPVLLKYLGKTGEETNELGGICCRMIIQGVDGVNPETQKPNKKSLEDEIADVLSCCHLLIEKLNLNQQHIHDRMVWKMEFLKPLHEVAANNL